VVKGYDLGDRSFPERRARVDRRRKALIAAGALGGLAVLNTRLERSGGDLSNRLGGETRYYRWRGGYLAYAVAGEGEPLLLVHGIYAGASSFEFRNNFGELSKDFRVYALDLLGCGLSERPLRRYGPEDVTAQVEDFVREEIGAAAHLVASSLSGALSIPALVRSPQLFRKSVLICPTGYRSLGKPSGYLGGAIYGLFLAPVLGDTLYHAIVSRRGIRYYLGNLAYHDAGFVTEDLVESYYRTGHQRGAKYFPAAFVSGKLAPGAEPDSDLLGPGGQDYPGLRGGGVRAAQPPQRTPPLQRCRPPPPRRAGGDLQPGGARVPLGQEESPGRSLARRQNASAMW
jgi:pimeloyl-ACP methyl ester carboxylesterase